MPQDTAHAQASMGPGQFSPGELRQSRNIPQWTYASMGPGQFSPGENSPRHYPTPSKTSLLQWGRGNLAPESPQNVGLSHDAQGSFNGAGAI